MKTLKLRVGTPIEIFLEDRVTRPIPQGPSRRLDGLRQVALALALVTQGALAADLADDLGWTLERDRDGIQVYTRTVEGSKFKAVKSTMSVTAGLGELVALVRDVSACPDWAALCKEAENLEVVSETEVYAYTLNDIPWPVSDRDAVGHILWSQNPEDRAVTMTAAVVDGRVPKKRGVVRLSYGVTSWKFTPTPDGKVLVESRAHVDPGGAMPAWLANMLLIDSPFDTMAGMRETLGSGRYEGSHFDFMTEQ